MALPTSLFYGSSRCHTYLQDAIADAEEGRGPADIVITCPPDGGDGSDVENIDENLQNSAMPNEVAGQLETIHYTEEDEVSEPSPPRSKKRKLDTPKWKTSHIPPKNTNGSSFDAAQAKKILANKHPEIIGVSEWSVFEKVFKNILDHLVVETNRFAQQSNNHSFKIEENEMRNFIGLLFLSAYNIRLNLRDYWSKSFDLECKAFSECMSRNRFTQIKSMFHGANNQSLGDNKMAKVLQ